MAKIAFTFTRAVDLPQHRFSQNSRLLDSIKWISALKNFTQIGSWNAEIMFRICVIPVSKEWWSLLGFRENLACWTNFKEFLQRISHNVTKAWVPNPGSQMTRGTWCPYKTSLPLLRKEDFKMEGRTKQKETECREWSSGLWYPVVWCMSVLIYTLKMEAGRVLWYPDNYATGCTQSSLVTRSLYLASHKVSNKSV